MSPPTQGMVHRPVALHHLELGGSAESQAPPSASLLTKNAHFNKILKRSACTLTTENHLLSILAGRGLGQRLMVKAYS